MKLVPLFLTVALIGACADDAGGETSNRDEPAESARNDAPPQMGWSVQDVDDGQALAFRDDDGVVLRMSCYGDPPLFSIYVRVLQRDEARPGLALRLGSTEIAMNIEQNRRPGGVGVYALAPLPIDLAEPLRSAGSLSAVHGDQESPPLDPPGADDVEALIASCREYGPVG